MFPYECGPDIHHWTLWCKIELTDQEAIQFVSHWLTKYMPFAEEWNFDSNGGLRSIDLYHIHVYIKVKKEEISYDDWMKIRDQGGDDEILKDVLLSTRGSSSLEAFALCSSNSSTSSCAVESNIESYAVDSSIESSPLTLTACEIKHEDIKGQRELNSKTESGNTDNNAP